MDKEELFFKITIPKAQFAECTECRRCSDKHSVTPFKKAANYMGSIDRLL